jgi:hypothetical protein
VTAPGIYPEFDELAYHRDPALSASGAKRLLPPNCPALFKHDRDNGGRPNKRAFDVGHAAHAAVLGVGLELVVVTRRRQALDYATKARRSSATPPTPRASARCSRRRRPRSTRWRWRSASTRRLEAARPGARQARGVRVLARREARHRPSRPLRLAARHRRWPAGRRGLQDDGQRGAPEVRQVDLRLRLRHPGRLLHRRTPRPGIAEDVTFLFIAQETTAPYLITVHELDEIGLRLGRERVDRACAVFAECTATGIWPGYSDDIELVTPPYWLTDEYGMELI